MFFQSVWFIAGAPGTLVPGAPTIPHPVEPVALDDDSMSYEGSVMIPECIKFYYGG